MIPAVSRRGQGLLARCLAVGLLALVAGAVAQQIGGRLGTVDERARRLAAAGELRAAEELWWGELSEGRVDLPRVIAFVENHATLMVTAPFTGQRPVVDDAEISRLVDDRLAGDAADLAQWWWRRTAGDPAATEDADVRAMADRTPPVPLANRLLARAALEEGDTAGAAARFEREGLLVAGQEEDLVHALRLLASLERWDEVEERLAKSPWREAAPASFVVRAAFARRDWTAALRAFPGSLYDDVRFGPLVLALVAGGLWFVLIARLGRLGDRPRARAPLYLAGFLLGAMSTWPTLFVGEASSALGFVPTGQPIQDLIFFIFGVGLREELLKLGAFALLLPVLVRRGGEGRRLEVLGTAAFVGLGFAAEENLGYFHGGALDVTIGRFLTANFLHVAMTAILGAALAEMVASPSTKSDDFTREFLLVVGLHGLYDFFLASASVSDWSFLSMTIFVLLAQRFLREIRHVRPVGGPSLRDGFVLALVALAGITFAWASARIGAGPALLAMGEGLLGSAILVILFMRELPGD